MIRYPFTRAEQELYIRAHPVVFWLCIGLTIEGFLGLVFPHLFLASVVSQTLPPWMVRVFYGMYMLGGGLCVIAQLRARAKWEAGGMSLLSTVFLIQFLSIVVELHGYLWQGLFLLTLAIGCNQRSVFLTRFGYPVRTISHETLHRRIDCGD